MEIESGHYGDVEIDGLSAVLTYRLGEWLRVYVDDKASDAQVDAVAAVLNQESTFGMFFGGETHYGLASLSSLWRKSIRVERCFVFTHYRRFVRARARISGCCR